MSHILRTRALHLLTTLALLIVLDLTPSTKPLREHLQRASAAVEGGQMDAASTNLEAALELEPKLASIREQAARAALMTDQPSLALRHLEVLAQARESPPDAECLKVEAYLALGSLQRALDRLEEAGLQCEAGVALANTLATESLAAGEVGAAIDSLQLWTSIRPASPEAHAALGMLMAVDSPEAALHHLRLSMELDPGGDPLLPRLIRAIEDSRPADSQAYTLAQLGFEFIGGRRWDLAQMAFEHAVRLRPDFAEAWAYLGLAVDGGGGSGLRELTQAIELAPDLTVAHLFLGKHWLRAGVPSRALESLEYAAALDPHNPAIAAELGATYAALGDMRSAQAAYQKATELAPDGIAFWRLLATFSLEYEIGLQEVGLGAAREALARSPQDPAALDLLGYCHFLLGNFPLADRYLWEAIELNPSLPSPAYHRGLLLLAQGDLEGGRRALETAVALDPQGRIGELADRSLANLEGR